MSDEHKKTSASEESSKGQTPINATEDVSQLISPTFNDPDPGRPTATYQTQAEWEADRRKLADVAHDSLNSFLKSSIYQRADLLRDTLLVAVTILVGALTLYFTNPDSIRTVPLFFAALLVLTSGLVANLVARAEIVRHLQAVSYQIERNYINIYGASRQVLGEPSSTNIDTAWRIERETPAFPELKKRGQYGHLIAIWSIVVSVVGIAVSFIFKISL